MNLQPVIEIYLRQIENLRQLNEIMFEKHEALLKADHSGFELIVKKEEKAIMLIQSGENIRLSRIQDFLTQYFPQRANHSVAKLSVLLNGCVPPAQYDLFEKIEKEISGQLNKLKQQNSKNMLLIQSARSFFSETIASLLGGKRKTLVDRKV